MTEPTRLTTDARGMVHAQIAAEVTALAGKEVVISGFILPIEATLTFKPFHSVIRRAACSPARPTECRPSRFSASV